MGGRKEGGRNGGRQGWMEGGRNRWVDGGREGDSKIVRQRMTDRWTDSQSQGHKVHILINLQTHALMFIISYTSSAS